MIAFLICVVISGNVVATSILNIDYITPISLIVVAIIIIVFVVILIVSVIEN